MIEKKIRMFLEFRDPDNANYLTYLNSVHVASVSRFNNPQFPDWSLVRMVGGDNIPVPCPPGELVGQIAGMTPVVELLDFLRDEKVDLRIAGGGFSGQKEFLVSLTRKGEPADHIDVPVGTQDVIGEILGLLRGKFDG